MVDYIHKTVKINILYYNVLIIVYILMWNKIQDTIIDPSNWKLSDRKGHYFSLFLLFLIKYHTS